MLGSFGISGNLALQTINSLSGGQKSRVAFALMCAAMPNFFVLDEPTNHLDIESIEALGKALNNCQVSVEFFFSRLCSTILKFLYIYMCINIFFYHYRQV